MSGIYRGPNSSVAAQFVNADGDKGDVVVSNSGELWTIDAGTIDDGKVSSISATKITNTPSGNLTSTDVQAALNELQTDVDGKVSASDLSTHISNTTSPHLSTSIPVVPSGNLASTNVGAALEELQSDIDTRATTSVVNLKVDKTSSTGSAVLPSSTTANRDGTPAAGYLRFNTTLTQFEGYNGSAWGAVGGGATGGVGNAAFYENDQTITADYTLTAGKNAMSAGPITIADGVTVSIPDGASWSIVG